MIFFILTVEVAGSDCYDAQHQHDTNDSQTTSQLFIAAMSAHSFV